MNTPTRTACAVVALLGSLTCGVASAQTKTQALMSCTENNSSTNDNGNSYGGNANCTGLKFSAYSIGVAAGAKFATAAVTGPWSGSGFGVGNATERYRDASGTNWDHSIDNKNSNGIDMLLLSFTGSQALTNVTVGSASGDSDFQVLRYTGTGAPTTGPKALTTLNSSTLLSSGWQLVKTVDGGNAGGSYNFNTTVVNGKTYGMASSSYWLITAYNSALGGGLNGGDAFKLLSIATTKAVSEPGTLAIAGLALFGVFAARRRAAAGRTAAA